MYCSCPIVPGSKGRCDLWSLVLGRDTVRTIVHRRNQESGSRSADMYASATVDLCELDLRIVVCR